MGSWLDNAYEYGVNLLKDLVSIPTVSPIGENYDKIANLLEKTLSSLGFNVNVIEVDKNYQRIKCKKAGENPRYIVLARIGDGDTVYHVNGHYDVVPGGPGWTVTDPFKPVIKDGKLYGRGAIDMKGGIAAAIAGIKAAFDRGYSPKKLTIEMAFVPDEEIGGQCGTGYLVENVLEKMPDFVLIPEPSGLRAPWHGHKGALWAKIRVKGRTAHASTPWLGRNAFLSAARAALMLDSLLASRLTGRRTKHKITPPEAAVSTYMIGGIAGIPGGGKTNQVPGEFEFTVDRRLIPEESVEGAKAELEDAMRWISTSIGVEYEVEYIEEMAPVVSRSDRLYKALKQSAASVGIDVGDPELCPGGLDLRYYLERGVEGLSYGPSGRLAHAPDEYIELEEFKKLIEIFSMVPEYLEAMV